MSGFDVNYIDADADLMGKAFGKDTPAGLPNPVIRGSDGGMPPAGKTGDDAPPAPAAPELPAPVEPAAPATPPAAPPAPAAAAAPEPVNYEGISNGLIKSVDDITRIATEYNQLKAKTADLEAKIAVNPFANDFAKELNQMYADGKSAEQIKTFIMLQDIGDISKLSPIDAMVKARVFKTGQDPDLVQKSIERKYGITPNMDKEERDLIDLDLDADSRPDKEYLATLKKDLTTPAPTAPVVNTPAIAKEVIEAQLVPVKEKVTKQFTSLGDINLNAKVDKDGKATDEAIVFNLAIPKSFQDKMPALMDDFFLTSGLEVTKENMATFFDVANVELFKNHGVDLIQSCVNHALSIQEAKIRAEYENTGGLPPKSRQGGGANQKLVDAKLENDVYASIARGD